MARGKWRQTGKQFERDLSKVGRREYLMPEIPQDQIDLVVHGSTEGEEGGGVPEVSIRKIVLPNEKREKIEKHIEETKRLPRRSKGVPRRVSTDDFMMGDPRYKK